MAKNYIQKGKTLSLTAPYARTSGQGALVGSLFGVALAAVDNAAVGEFCTEGVWELTKTSAQAWAVGQKIYWDNSNKRCDSDPTVGQLIGVATAVAANPTSTGYVRLNESVPSMAEGAQATIAAFTMDAGITAATANGALVGSAGANPSQAEFNELAKEVATKINDILVALKAAGIVASS